MGRTTLRDAAMSYVNRGWSVFLLQPRSKEPATSHGLKDADNDPIYVDTYWGQHPDCNIGVALGAASGNLFVIDLDEHEDGPCGMDFLREWERDHGALPETVSSVTGSGGYHLWFRSAQPLRCSVNREIAVDIRADGGYVVAPPSVHPNGRTYEWEVPPEEHAVACADENVLAFVDAVRPGGFKGQGQRFELPETIGSGQRNDTIFRLASSMQAQGKADAEILDYCMFVNARRCSPPMPDGEVRKAVESALRFEKGQRAEPSAAVVGDAAQDAPSFARKGGGVQHDSMGEWLIREMHACTICGTPAVWTGQRWEMGVGAIERACISLKRDIKRNDRNEVVAYVQAVCPGRELGDFDSRPFVQFANCTVDALTGEAVEPDPSMLVCNRLPVDLDWHAESADADAFLWRVACEDLQVLTVLHEVVGACMTTRRIVSQAPMLIGRARGGSGEASNGKSTFLNFLRDVLGSENVSSLDLATLGQRFQAARIVGRLANIGDDIPNDFLKGDELAVFKKIVTGDKIYTDVKGGSGFEFVPMATLVFSMNAVPRLSDCTEGVMRRMAFVPFRQRFVPGSHGFDPHVGARLRDPRALEYLALQGLLAISRIHEAGVFSRIEGMEEELAAVRIDNDTVLRWMDEEGVTEASLYGVRISSVYERYAQWAQLSGVRNIVSRRVFTQRVCNALRLRSVTGRPENGESTARVFMPLEG